MDEKKIEVRIKPLHNIGGIGKAGDVVWMTEAQAEIYIEEGYVEIVEQEGQPLRSAPTEYAVPAEDHVIFKPQSKRRKK